MNIVQSKEYIDLLVRYPPFLIQNAEDYQHARLVLRELMSDKPRSREKSAVLSLFAALIEKYEKLNYPNPDASPIEVLKTLMEDRGKKQSDLVGVISNSKGVVSEILSGKRAINAAHARKLSEFFEINIAAFL